MSSPTLRRIKGAALTFDEVDTNFSDLALAIAGTSGARNLLINGNPIINQRQYALGAATTIPYQYTLDRWRVVTAGQSVSWVDSGGVRTVTAPMGGLQQVIEGSSIIAGRYSLSWIGTAAATVNGSPVSNGGSIVLPGGAPADVKFSSGSFSRAQFEPGDTVTRFEQRLYGQELSLCQRYCQTGKVYGRGYGPPVGAHRASWNSFATTMQTLPNIEFTYMSTDNCTFGAVEGLRTSGFGIYVYPVNTGHYAIDADWLATAEI
jgi:hypothetical protein